MMAAAVSDVTLSQSIFPEERMENFLMKSLQIEENVSFFASDNGRLVVEMFLYLWFLVVIELYNKMENISIYYKELVAFFHVAL